MSRRKPRKRRKERINVDTLSSNARRFVEEHTLIGGELKTERVLGELVRNPGRFRKKGSYIFK